MTSSLETKSHSENVMTSSNRNRSDSVNEDYFPMFLGAFYMRFVIFNEKSAFPLPNVLWFSESAI